MSSVDSMLLQSTSTLINDLALRKFSLTEASQKRWTWITTLFVAITCTVLALNPPKMIIWLNLAAFGALQVVFLWPLLLGLFWEKLPSQAVLAGVWVGLIVYLVQYFFKFKIFGFHPVVTALGLSYIVVVSGQNILGRRISPAIVEYHYPTYV